QRDHMAVVYMDTKGLRIKLIERFTTGDNRGKCSINIASMNTVKMYPMRHIALIDKMYTNTISCGSSYCWSWHPTIKRPARKWLAGGGIKGFIGRDNRVLTQRLSIGKFAD